MRWLEIYAFFVLPVMLAAGGWAYSRYTVNQIRSRRKQDLRESSGSA